MEHSIDHGPSFSLLSVTLGPNEVITAEAGSMVTRDGAVVLTSRLNASKKRGFFVKLGAFFVALMRKLIGGETFFINELTAPAHGGKVRLAPSMAGHIVYRPLANERLLLAPGAFLACDAGIDMRLRWGGLRGIFSASSPAFTEVSGTGDLFLAAYGGIQTLDVDGELIVDNGHLVAFESGLDFNITSAGGGVLGFVASGEGLVCRFRGRGKVWIQTRNVSALVGWLARM